jgi:c-di-GMP-binding flagellar brake protein YcgR
MIEISILRSGDGEYLANLTILATRIGVNLIFLPHTRALERKQLRNWVRIDVNIPCRVTVMGKPEDWKEGAAGPSGPHMGMVLEGRLIDLSGGGACARFSSPIPQGHKLSLNFDLPGTSLRGIQSEVMRMTSVVRSSREDFEHNLKFRGMETTAQEKIVRYVFEKQRIDSQMRGPIKIP